MSAMIFFFFKVFQSYINRKYYFKIFTTSVLWKTTSGAKVFIIYRAYMPNITFLEIARTHKEGQHRSRSLSINIDGIYDDAVNTPRADPCSCYLLLFFMHK